MKNLFYFLLIVPMIFFGSCGNEEKPVEQYDYDRADSLSAEYTREVLSIRGNIKETSNFYLTLRNLGAEFNSALPNSPSRASNYTTTSSRCIAMGIYGADLNYITVNEQNETARNYVEDISRLADELGIGNAFDQDLFDKIVSTEDTLDLQTKSNLVSKAFRKAEDKMYNEERALYATLMVAGGWVESVYLTSNLILDNNISENAISDFWLLVNNYYSITKMLGVFINNQDAQIMLNKFNDLEDAVKMITDNPRITRKGIQAINDKIEKLRKELI